MMEWRKLGLVFDCRVHGPSWASGGALTPTPIALDEDTIRVFAGFRDKSGVSRLGFVDVSAENPTKINAVSQEPLIELGPPGSFDDNGQIMGHIEKINGCFHLYYVGFQLAKNTKFLAFSGLATSTDLKNFSRFSNVPILDRTNEGLYINAIHSLLPWKGQFKVYFAAGKAWQKIGEGTYPCYEIFETTTADGIHFSRDAKKIISVDEGRGEYRIGRPSVFQYAGRSHMFFTSGSLTGADYFPGYAQLNESGEWVRNDKILGLSLSPEGFDSRHLCYPRFLTVNGKSFIFYNGNNMGKDGFGVAQLTSVNF